MFKNSIRSRSGLGLLAGCAAVMMAYLATVGLFVSQYGRHPEDAQAQTCVCTPAGQSVACHAANTLPTC